LAFEGCERPSWFLTSASLDTAIAKADDYDVISFNRCRLDVELTEAIFFLSLKR